MPTQKPPENHIKQMANLLKQGTTMTNLACPQCASPLFKLKNNTLWCAQCQKKVIILKQDEEPPKTANTTTLDTLENTLLTKIQEIQNKIQHEQNPEKLQKLASTLSELLENLEKTRKAKKG